MPQEASLWKLLKANLPKEAHVQRIETGGTARGVPDVNVCHAGKEVWIELKSIKGNKLTLTEFQIVWMHNRSISGGNCFILVKKDKELRAFDISEYELEEFLEGKVNWNSDLHVSLSPPYELETLFKFIF